MGGDPEPGSSNVHHAPVTHQTNQQVRRIGTWYSQSALVFCARQQMAVQKDNFRRLLRAVEALSDLGPAITVERDFPQTARAMLSALQQAADAREVVLFVYTDKPSLLNSVAGEWFRDDAGARHHPFVAQARPCAGFRARPHHFRPGGV